MNQIDNLIYQKKFTHALNQCVISNYNHFGKLLCWIIIYQQKSNRKPNKHTISRLDKNIAVYYQECGDEETIAMVETSVFHQLGKYREQANCERFNLPEKEEIELFSNTINKSINFLKNKIYKKYFIFKISKSISSKNGGDTFGDLFFRIQTPI